MMSTIEINEKIHWRENAVEIPMVIFSKNQQLGQLSYHAAEGTDWPD